MVVALLVAFRRAVSTSIRANKLVARLLHLIVADRCTRSRDSFLSVSFFFLRDRFRRNRLSEMKISVVTRWLRVYVPPRFFVNYVYHDDKIVFDNDGTWRAGNADADKGTNWSPDAISRLICTSNINVTSLFRVTLRMLFRYIRYKVFDKINTKKLKNIILNFGDPHTHKIERLKTCTNWILRYLI